MKGRVTVAEKSGVMAEDYVVVDLNSSQENGRIWRADDQNNRETRVIST